MGEEENKLTTEQKQGTSTDVAQPGVGTSTDGNNANPLQKAAQSLSVQPLRATGYSDVDIKPKNVQLSSKPEPYAGYNYVQKTLSDEMNRLAAQEETPKQKAKREKRERTNRKIAAISDGVRALSNLFFTTQYAPNMYNHEKDSGYKALDERLQQAKKEREANHEQYLNYVLKLGDMREKEAKTAHEQKQQADKAKIAADEAQRAAAAEKHKEALRPYEVQEAAAKAKTAQAAADYAEALNSAKVETEESKKDVNDSRVRANDAQADRNNRSLGYGVRSSSGGGSGSGNHSKYNVRDSNGNKVYEARTYQEAQTKVSELNQLNPKGGYWAGEIVTERQQSNTSTDGYSTSSRTSSSSSVNRGRQQGTTNNKSRWNKVGGGQSRKVNF